MRGAERTVTVVGDGGHDGIGLAVVGDTTGIALDLAQRVGVFAGSGVLDGDHRDVALGVIGAGGDHVVALDELEVELALLEVAAVQDLGRGDLVGDAGLIRIRLVAVVELRLVSALQLVRSAECAVAVVGDGGHDGIGLAVVGDAVAGGSAVGLAQRVGVLAGLGVLDGVHRDLAASDVGAGGDDLGIFALALDELEGELVGLEVTAGQDLGRGDLVGDAGDLGARLVGIGELGLLVFLQDMLGLEGAVAVVGDGGHDSVLGGAVGDAANVTLDLAQRVGVLAGLGVLHGAHRDVAGGVVGAGSDDLGVLVLALNELEGELVGLEAELAPGQDLGRGDLVGDAELVRLHTIGIREHLILGLCDLGR